VIVAVYCQISNFVGLQNQVLIGVDALGASLGDNRITL
jgi:hypothetical protein